MRSFAILLIIGSCLVPSASRSIEAIQYGRSKKAIEKAPGSFKIGFIRNQADSGGCGCEFSSPSEMKKRSPRLIFAADEEEQRGWMNVDGRDLVLKLIHSVDPK